MIRVCGWCRCDMGEKEPLQDKSETTGMCPQCARIFLHKKLSDAADDLEPVRRVK